MAKDRKETKQTPKERNEELLKETANRLNISEDEVLSSVPKVVKWYAHINPKALGGYLKRMTETQENGTVVILSQEEVITKQVHDELNGGNKEKYNTYFSKIKEAPESFLAVLARNFGISDLKEIGFNSDTGSVNTEQFVQFVLKPELPDAVSSQEVREIIDKLGEDSLSPSEAP